MTSPSVLFAYEIPARSRCSVRSVRLRRCGRDNGNQGNRNQIDTCKEGCILVCREEHQESQSGGGEDCGQEHRGEDRGQR